MDEVDSILPLVILLSCLIYFITAPTPDTTIMPTSLETPSTQESILLSLIQTDQARTWAESKAGWKSNSPYSVCYWDHIICDSELGKDVVRILIEGESITGSLPSQLGMLHELQDLSLPKNALMGTIPQEIADLPKLQVVNLSKNGLSGRIPHFTSSQIARVNLGSNSFTGTIPADIGAWNPMLVMYDAMNNQISGPIPSSFSKCKTLDTLNLSDNDLTGTIPYSLGSCPMLRFLYLDGNHLVGSIPNQIAIPGRPMKEFWLHGNELSGTVPASIADLPDLFNFYIDGNKFTGTIPDELCQKKLNEDFFINKQTGQSIIPEADRNYCDSVACPAGQYSNIGVYPCKPCDANTFDPYLGHKDKCFSTDTRTNLRTFYDSLNGDQWALDTNKWDFNNANSNYCEFYGITCDNKQNVISISLPEMGLSGTIPQEVGFLRFLEHLNLRDNYITGNVPSDLRWPPLLELDVSGNQMVGMIPAKLCYKEGINGNGQKGSYSCRTIACPIGTYSASGRGVSPTYPDEEQCQPCPSAQYLGSKLCVDAYLYEDMETNSYNEWTRETIFGMFLIVFFILSGCVYLSYVRLRNHKLRKLEQTALTHNIDSDNVDSGSVGSWHVEDYDSEMRVLRQSVRPDRGDSGSIHDDSSLSAEDMMEMDAGPTNFVPISGLVSSKEVRELS